MNPSDTIAAVASGAGVSARAIIRVSGPGTRAVLERVLVDAPSAPGARPSRLTLDPSDRQLDLPCLVVRFDSPRSYTGQDGAELQVPGNPALVERVMRLLLGGPEGARQAEPGEFTARAFLSGKLALDRAEGVQALIAARTGSQLAAAGRLVRGELGEACREIADELTTLLALVEAGIDFSDQEDVVAIEPGVLRERCAAVVARLDRLAGPQSAREELRTEPVVVIAGPPNAGKSTLFNALLARERAMVSEEAGSTRDALRESLTLEEAAGSAPGERAPAVSLVDLAGLDAALEMRSEADLGAQRAARRALESADVIVLCRPTGGAGLDEGELALGGRPVIRVRTKADLPRVDGDSPSSTLAVCALDGWNMGPLRRAIADAAFGAGAPGSDHWVLPRHRRSLSAARRAIEGLVSGAEELSQAELAAVSLRRALDQVGSIVGAVTPDDVIGRVFATFCVGK